MLANRNFVCSIENNYKVVQFSLLMCNTIIMYNLPCCVTLGGASFYPTGYIIV